MSFLKYCHTPVMTINFVKSIINFFRANMSNQSPTSIVTHKQSNKEEWQSPILKPLPKALLRSFNYEAKIDPYKGLVRDEDDENQSAESEEQQDAKYASFASDWAKEDRERNAKLDMLDALEDCMETNMKLSDQIVRLISKLKRELRSF